MLAGEDLDAPMLEPTPTAAITLAVPEPLLLDDLEPPVAAAFERALSRLSAAGCRLVDVALPPLARIHDLTAAGGFAAAEAFAWHRALLATRGAEYDPLVAKRIRRGEAITTPDYLALLEGRRALIDEMRGLARPYTAVVCPTAPITAPAIAPLRADEALYTATNLRILRNTTLANYLDTCAISLPCHEPGSAPVGLMLIGKRLADCALLRAALKVEAILGA